VNPVMACDGCELWPTISQLVSIIAETAGILAQKEQVAVHLTGYLPSDVYHCRAELARKLANSPDPRKIAVLEKAIKESFRCYAGQLHLLRGENIIKPWKKSIPGYARKFEEPELFPGRMTVAAGWSDLSGSERLNAVWKKTLPRIIFVSDMGDALSRSVPFEYLLQEIITVASSSNGKRHIWLWLTKRPRRMAQFSEWLNTRDISWPDNLVAMTSVTSVKTIGRVEQLLKVRCKFRGLSVEPLWSPVTLPLCGINWVIVGGESGSGAKPFNLDWARDIIRQCRTAGVAPFVKQLGAVPFDGGRPLDLHDSHGGDWNEWPLDLRVREFPKFETAFNSPGN